MSGAITTYLGHGTFAARPATPSIDPGAIGWYWATDTSKMSFWTGSAWVEDVLAGGGGYVAGPASAVADRIAVFNGVTGKIVKDGGVTVADLLSGSSYTPPIASAFTTYGTGLTVADKVGRMALTRQSGAGLAGVRQASIATPYTIDAKIQILTTPATGADAVVAGLYLSSGTAIRAFYSGMWTNTSGPIYSTKCAVDSYSSPTVYVATVNTKFTFFQGGGYHVRITDDGTTRKFLISSNGLDFMLVYSEPTNTYVTPSYFGVAVFNSTSSSTDMRVSVEHWKVTASVLGDAA